MADHRWLSTPSRQPVLSPTTGFSRISPPPSLQTATSPSLSDGEVRLSHPLNSHLAHTAALWQKACEPVANWLAQAFGRAAGGSAVLTADDRMIPVSQHVPA